MEIAASSLRLRVPCNDQGEFWSRLADHVAQRGLRVPTDAPKPIGSHVTVALEFKNGETLTGEGVVDAHVRMDARPGVNVRILRFREAARARPAPRPAGTARTPAPELPEITTPPPVRGTALEEIVFDEPLGDGPRCAGPLGDEPLGDEPLGPAAGYAAPTFASTVSAEIVAAVRRTTRRVQRGALVLGAAALAVALAGLGAVRWLGPATPDAVWSAHMDASDRLLAEGRLVGRDGALEHLLAAKRVRPDDTSTARQLSRVADLLEALAARALERGDVAVAEIHLASAERAAPGRASIRAKREAITRRTAGVKPPARSASSR